MTATEVLEKLGQLGVTVWPHGGNIRFQPASRVPPTLKDAVREHKPEILALLSDQPRHGDGQPPPLDRPPETEKELRRLINHLADPVAFSAWLEELMERDS